MNKTPTWLICFLTLMPLLMVLVVLSTLKEQRNNLVKNIDEFNLAGEQSHVSVELVFANGDHEVDNLTC